MPERNLAGMRVAIVATDLFEESELTSPKQALENAGALALVVAPHSGEIQAVRHDEKSIRVKVDKTLDQVNAGDFDAVMIPGGALNADALRVDRRAQEFVRQINQSGKPVAVICHGPWLLISASLTNGRRMTSYHTIRDDIRNSGAEWADEECIRDDNWVSSRQPSDLPRFNQEMINLFQEHFTRQRDESKYRGREAA